MGRISKSGENASNFTPLDGIQVTPMSVKRCTYPSFVARGHTRTTLRILMHPQLLVAISDELLKLPGEEWDA